MRSLRVLIPDLTCASCVPAIEQVMRQQDGVIWATVNFAAGDATVIYDVTLFNAVQFAQAVGQLGFELVSPPEQADLFLSHIPVPRTFERMQQWVMRLFL